MGERDYSGVVFKFRLTKSVADIENSIPESIFNHYIQLNLQNFKLNLLILLINSSLQYQFTKQLIIYLVRGT